MFLRPSALLSIVFLAVSMFGQTSFGQVPFGRATDVDMRNTVMGVVNDYSGHPVFNARVELQEPVTGRMITAAYTRPNGTFELPDVPSGQYQLVTFVGIAQANNQIDTRRDHDIAVRIAADSSDNSVPGTTAVSVSQMKVPGKARKMFQKAMDAFRLAHLDDAFTFVQKALGMYPDYAQALTLRGVLNLQKGDTAKAQPDLEKAVELDYSDDMGFVALASLYNTEGKYDEAIRILDRGIALHPNSWQALTEMGRAQIGKKNYEAALKSLVKTDGILPTNIHYPKLLRAQAYSGLKNYEAAMSELETFLKEEPSGPNTENANKMLQSLRDYKQTMEAKK